MVTTLETVRKPTAAANQQGKGKENYSGFGSSLIVHMKLFFT